MSDIVKRRSSKSDDKNQSTNHPSSDRLQFKFDDSADLKPLQMEEVEIHPSSRQEVSDDNSDGSQTSSRPSSDGLQFKFDESDFSQLSIEEKKTALPTLEEIDCDEGQSDSSASSDELTIQIDEPNSKKLQVEEKKSPLITIEKVADDIFNAASIAKAVVSGGSLKTHPLSKDPSLPITSVVIESDARLRSEWKKAVSKFEEKTFPFREIENMRNEIMRNELDTVQEISDSEVSWAITEFYLSREVKNRTNIFTFESIVRMLNYCDQNRKEVASPGILYPDGWFEVNQNLDEMRRNIEFLLIKTQEIVRNSIEIPRTKEHFRKYLHLLLTVILECKKIDKSVDIVKPLHGNIHIDISDQQFVSFMLDSRRLYYGLSKALQEECDKMTAFLAREHQ